MARTDADSAGLLTTDIDPRDRDSALGNVPWRVSLKCGAALKRRFARGLAYALMWICLWCETSKPNLEEAREFADGIHAVYPGKMLAYTVRLRSTGESNLSNEEIARFQLELARWATSFSSLPLAGFHALNQTMFELARGI